MLCACGCWGLCEMYPWIFWRFKRWAMFGLTLGVASGASSTSGLLHSTNTEKANGPPRTSDSSPTINEASSSSVHTRHGDVNPPPPPRPREVVLDFRPR